MTPATDSGSVRSTLIDISNCIGCRACQVACKQWNEKDGEKTEFDGEMGFQNPAVLSAKTLTLIKFHEMANPEKQGGVEAAYVMQRCLHCLEPACVSACPTTALHRQSDGPVSYETDDCIGCRYCMLACPWDVPTAEWNTRAPKISKCTHCADRAVQPPPVSFNGQPMADAAAKQFADTMQIPACVKACPADALRYGTREEMLAIAHKRIAARPDKYVNHIYGEKELGGTSVLYLSSVPFEKLGFPTYGEKPFPAFSAAALGAVPPAVLAVGATLAAAYAFFRKRAQAVADSAAAARHAAASRPRRIRTVAERAADAVQLGPAAADGVRRRFVHRAFRPGTRRQHAPVRHLPVGAVDRLRPGLDRGSRRRLRDGRCDLCLSAKRSLRAWPHRRPDGTPQLLLRGGDPDRRPRTAVALVRARLEPSRTLGHVRSLVVRHPLRHDPSARIPAGTLRALRLRPGARRRGGDGTART